MEVASPLSSFVPVAGSKRSLPCSPGIVGMSEGMVSSSSSVFEASGAVGEASTNGVPAFAGRGSSSPAAAPGFAAMSFAALAAAAAAHSDAPPSKRRRYLDASVESLSEVFSSHSPFVSGNGKAAASTSPSSTPPPHQRLRTSGAFASSSTIATAASVAASPGLSTKEAAASRTPSALELERKQQQRKHDALQAQIDEQAALIASLKQDKTASDSELAAVKLQAERSQKENALLRRAVNIQQEKHVSLESQLRDAQSQKAQADEKVRVLEQMVVTLRYHLQASSASSGPLNDFLGGMPPRPPDVY